MGVKLTRKFKQYEAKVDELLCPMRTYPESPLDDRKMATENSHPTFYASDPDNDLLAEGDVDGGEEEL